MTPDRRRGPRPTRGLPGQQYGRLTVVAECEPQRAGGKPVRRVFCSCTCGGSVVTRVPSLESGATKSCGCIEAERIAAARTVQIEDRGYETPCHIWQGTISPGGYGRINLGGRVTYAHRVSFEAAGGVIPDGCHLDHLCRTRSCVRPDHLEPVTQAENVRRGAGTKLTGEQVAEIRKAEFSDRYYADLYGIHTSHVCRIRNGRAWRA